MAPSLDPPTPSLMPLALALTAAIGGCLGGAADPGVTDPFVVRDAVMFRDDFEDQVIVSDRGGLCALLRAGREPRDSRWLHLRLRRPGGGAASELGTYPASVPGEDGRSVVATFLGNDGACADTIACGEGLATGGRVRVIEGDAGGLSGDFALDLAADVRLAGRFRAAWCDDVAPVAACECDLLLPVSTTCTAGRRRSTWAWSGEDFGAVSAAAVAGPGAGEGLVGVTLSAACPRGELSVALGHLPVAIERLEGRLAVVRAPSLDALAEQRAFRGDPPIDERAPILLDVHAGCAATPPGCHLPYRSVERQTQLSWTPPPAPPLTLVETWPRTLGGRPSGPAVIAKFNLELDPASVTNETFFVEGVAGFTSYDRWSRSAEFQPATELAPGVVHRVVVRGGPLGVRTLRGGLLGLEPGADAAGSTDVTWDFSFCADCE